jgi:hypothetical protein
MELREVYSAMREGKGRIYEIHINARSRRKEQVSSRREIERERGHD